MGMNWLFKPTTDLPSRAAKKVSEAISPANEVGNRWRGFLSGATEGAGNVVSDMTSPIGIASMLMGGAGGLASRLPSLFRGAQSAGRTMDVINDIPIKQVAPAADDVMSLIGDMQRNLARVPNRGAGQAAQQSYGVAPNMPAEMIHRGGEGLYNANRAAMMNRQATNIDDIAEAGSRSAGRVRMPVGGNVNVADMMAKLAAARGR